MVANPFLQRLNTRLVLSTLGLAIPMAAVGAGTDTTSSPQAPATTAAEQIRAPSVSSGSPDTGARKESLWNRLDRNGDGTVSRQEFDAQHPDVVIELTTVSTTSGALGGLDGRMFASNFIGTEVRNPQGESLGEIQDVVVDVRSGQVKSAILSYGGFADIGDKLLQYPLSSFSRAAGYEALVLNVDERALRSAKGIDRDNWPGIRGDARIGVWRASRLIGRDIEDRNGEHLGEVRDLVVDARAGKIDQVILRYDRPWSLDNPLVALPLRSLNFGDDRRDVSINVDKDQLESQRLATTSLGPTYTFEHWIFVLPEASIASTNPASRSGGARASDTAEQSVNGGKSTNSGVSASGASSASSVRNGAGTTGASVAQDASTDRMGPETRSPMAVATRTTVEFNRLDTDHDGRLTRQEYIEGPNFGQTFDSLDNNNDSVVSRNEFATDVSATN